MAKGYKDPSLASFKAFYRGYKASAKRNGRAFKLTIAQVRALAAAGCHYCGNQSMRSFTRHEGRAPFVYRSGIDRVDSSRGYETDNVVSCCERCNMLKASLSTDQFFSAILRIVQHQYRKGIEE